MILILIFLIVVALLLFKYLKFAYKVSRLDIPTPSGNCYPLIGHALWVVGLGDEQRLKTIISLFLQFPRMGKFWLGPIPIIGITHPELYQEVLTSEKCLQKTHLFYRCYQLNDSLVSAKIQKWKHDRKLLNHSFNLRLLQSFVSDFAMCTDQMVKRLQKFVNQGPFDIHGHVAISTLNMLIKTSYGDKLNETVEEQCEIRQKIVKAVDNIHKGISARFNHPLMQLKWVYDFTEVAKIDRDARSFAFGYQEKLFNDRKNQIQLSNNQENSFEKKQKIFVDQLIYNEDKFTEASIKDNLALLLLAGFETTANQAAHTILMLAMHPEVQEKLYEEISDVFFSDDVEMSGEILNTLHYLDQVIRETMRLFPIIPMISRQLHEDMVLDGKNIPRGTVIFMCIFALHRRPDIWGPNYDKFDPEHFSPENTAKRNPYSFIPFSAGMRNCTGQRYATMSIKVILVKLLKKFKLSTDMKMDDLRFTSDVILKLKMPHLIKLTIR